MSEEAFTTVEDQSRLRILYKRKQEFEFIVDLSFEEVDQVNGSDFIEHECKVVPGRKKDKGDFVGGESGLGNGDILGLKVFVHEQVAALGSH